MAPLLIQFRHGLSLPEFLQSFGTEDTGTKTLGCAHWANGFSCSQCSGAPR
jgi:hypothetical protein